MFLLNKYYQKLKDKSRSNVKIFQKSMVNLQLAKLWIIKMPFLGIIWILTISSLISNFCAISTAWGSPAKMAPKFELGLDFGKIPIVPKKRHLYN